MDSTYAPGRVYGLAFVPAFRGSEPGIVLKTCRPRGDLFERVPVLRTFAAVSAQIGDRIHFRFALSADRAQATAIALSQALGGLNDLLTQERGSDESPPHAKKQLIEVETGCTPQASMHGHPMSGAAYPSMRKWLVEYARRSIGPGRSEIRADAPDIVVQAMHSAWEAVAHKEMRRWKEMVGGYVLDDGRFVLTCFGNACDVSIYPDLDLGPDSEYPSRFDCHNLDSAPQQLTLLAGLAALHEVAAEELDAS